MGPKSPYGCTAKRRPETAVQIIHSDGAGSREIEHLGRRTVRPSWELLKAVARNGLSPDASAIKRRPVR